jgi:hypothetical protein
MNTNRVFAYTLFMLGVWLLILVLARLCFCAEPQPLQQCVKIHTEDKGGMSSRGTGTYVGLRLVASCAHNVRDRLSDDSVEIEFPSGESLAGKVLYFDETYDLSLIELSGTPHCKPLYMTPELTEGEPLSIQGYASGYRKVWGTLSEKRYGKTGQWRTIDGAASLQGESGGPVSNKHGEFCGVLWGSDGGQTYFTPGRVVIEKIKELSLPVPPITPPENPPNLYGDIE